MGPAASVSCWTAETKEKPQHVAGGNKGFIPAFSRALGGPFNALGNQLNNGGNWDRE